MLTALLLLNALAAAPLWEAPPSFETRYLGAARPGPTPARVVSVAPSVTELLFALGAGPRVVAVSRFADYPEAVTSLPKVGGFLDPSVEAIAGARPDLVIAVPNASNRPALDRVASLGVPVLVVPGNSLSDLFHAAQQIAAAVGGEAPRQAARLLAQQRAGFAALSARTASVSSRRALLVYGVDPLVVAGPGSFGAAALELLHLENVVSVPEAYPKYSLERLLADRPEVILDAAVLHAPGHQLWRRLRTPTGQVLRLEDPRLMRAGPRLLAALEALEARLSLRAQGASSSSK